jgi:hypothetical protein
MQRTDQGDRAGEKEKPGYRLEISWLLYARKGAYETCESGPALSGKLLVLST